MSILKSGRIASNAVVADEIDLINKYAKTALTPEEVYVFPILLCDNEVDRDLDRFPDETLVQLSALFIGKTGISNHEWNSGKQKARIYRTEVVSDPEKTTSIGTPYVYLKAYAYMLRTESNAEMIAEIEGGIKKEISVGCSVERNVCSICGNDYYSGDCPHRKGQTYDGKLCFVELAGAKDAYEFSFVAVPTQKNAGVMKHFKGDYQPKTLKGWGENLGGLRVLGRDSNLNYDVELDVMRSGLIEGSWEYLNVKEYATTFCGTPILCAYPYGKLGDGHNMEEKVDPATGKKYYSFLSPTAERIVGMISEKAEDIRVEERNGEKWIIAKGKLWRFYNKELVDSLAEQGRYRVSAETDVQEVRANAEKEIFEVWRGLGVTMLGDHVRPAIPGAHLHALAAMEPEFENLKIRAASAKSNKPQQETTPRKEDKTFMTIEEIQAKFNGYTVKGISEDGVKAALLSADGAPFIYAFKEGEAEIDTARIQPVKLSFGFGAEVSAEEICAPINAKLNSAETALSELRASADEKDSKIATLEASGSKKDIKITTLEADLASLKEWERSRRIQMAKNAVSNSLVERNASRSEADKFSDDIATALLSAVDAGDYAECVDKSGNWNGVELAENALKILCMDKQDEFDKARAEAEKNAIGNRFAGNAKKQQTGTLAELLAGID